MEESRGVLAEGDGSKLLVQFISGQNPTHVLSSSVTVEQFNLGENNRLLRSLKSVIKKYRKSYREKNLGFLT